MGDKNITFRGGYKFEHFDGQPKEKLIEFKSYKKIIIPLKQGFGSEVVPVVKEKEKVKTGQIIGIDNNSISSPVHSSISGIVEKIEKIKFFDQEINAITIKIDTVDNWALMDCHTSEWRSIANKKIEELLYHSGVTALGENGIPTSFNSSDITPDEVKDVIIHAADSEVFNLSPRVLVNNDKDDFVEGIEILKKVFPKAIIHLAISKKYVKLLKELMKLFQNNERLKTYTVEPKYPFGNEKMLIPTLLNREFPHGYSATKIGVITLDMQTILHIYNAVVKGKPVTERIVTLSGAGFKENIHLKVKIGTPLEDIISNRVNDEIEKRYILNSVLTGEMINDLSIPVDRTFENIIVLPEEKDRMFFAFAEPGFKRDTYSNTTVSLLSSFLGIKKRVETNVHGEPRSCLFCTFCADTCPARIIPHHLCRYVKNEVIDETLLKYEIFKCTECNLCSYLCISKIPVSKYIKTGKEKLKEIGLGIGEENKEENINKDDTE